MHDTAEPYATACPLLGLVRDRETRFQFPERNHRCWAKDSPKTIDLPFQRAVCLSPGFRDCKLYREWEKNRTASGS
jgi:hypothetical protein